MELIARRRDGQGEREDPVRIERAAEDREAFTVTVGERSYRVQVSALGGAFRSLLIGGDQYEVAVACDREGRYAVTAHGELVAVEMVDPLTALLEKGASASGRKRSQVVRAYMPGRIVSLQIEEGQTIEAGQALVVLEAMKMQNEVLAEHAGVVKKIFVIPGQSVDGGEPLFEFE
ncbi:MAG: biotin/lipoyl-containing protein [Acidobacteriota bacterium]